MSFGNVFLCLLLGLFHHLVHATTDLVLGGFFPDSGGWPVGPYIRPAFELAIQHVNTNYLGSSTYQFVGYSNDTKCAASTGLGALVDQRDKYDIDVIIGDGCSISCQPQSQLATNWELTSISWGCSSPSLSDKVAYPYFLRTLGSDAKQAAVFADLCTNYGWSQVGTINSLEDIHAQTMAVFLSQAVKNNLTILDSETFAGTATTVAQQIATLKSKGVRIIVVAAYANQNRMIVKEAMAQGLVGKGYQWMFTDSGFFTVDFWDSGNAVEDAEIKNAILGAIGPTSDSGSGAKYDQFVTDYLAFSSQPAPVNTYAGYAYDAVMAYYYVVKSMMDDGLDPKLKSNRKTLRDRLFNVTFEGVTGNIQFDSNGDRIPIYNIMNLQSTGYAVIGKWNNSSPTEKVSITSSTVLFGGGMTTPPKDKNSIVYVNNAVPSGQYGAACAFATLGILLGAFCLFFNYRYRKHPAIKFSSPRVNNVIIVGCMLGYSYVYTLGVDSMEGICNARLWTISLSYTLTFGALFSKTWRVHKLFNNRRMKNIQIKDSTLFAYIAGFLAVDIILLAAWTGSDSLKEVAEYGSSYIDPSDLFTQYNPYYLYCDSSNKSIWYGLVLGWKGILLAFGAFLAFETRQVKIPAMNDSHAIGMCLYNVLIVCVIVVPVSLLVQSQPVASFSLVAAGTIFSISIILLLLFVPKYNQVIRGVVPMATSPGTSGNTMMDDTRSLKFTTLTPTPKGRHVTRAQPDTNSGKSVYTDFMPSQPVLSSIASIDSDNPKTDTSKYDSSPVHHEPAVDSPLVEAEQTKPRLPLRLQPLPPLPSLEASPAATTSHYQSNNTTYITVPPDDLPTPQISPVVQYRLSRGAN
eukprot:GILK01008502.1.p1 GENE.GILK01008502.1~~GILK01008502.1.p1  ORF type:complete len:856 (+),score=154.80 GILK01008502.1:16-2583(+)